MKIAMIGHKRIPSREGGIEIVVDRLSSRLVQKHHTVVAYNRKGHHVSGKEFETSASLKEYNGIRLVNVFTLKNKKFNAIVYSALATLKAMGGGYDIFHFHAEGPAAMCWLPKLFGKRVIVTIHGLDWKRAKWGGFATKFLLFGEKCAVKHADEIIVLSKNVQNYFYQTYQRSTRYIPNGITRPHLRKPKIIQEKYGLAKDGYILYLGRLVPEKGVHYLIEAYNQLHTEKKLVIAGGISHSSEYMEELKALAKGNDQIIFTDFVQGTLLEELYSNAYLYCLPSDLEGMPISLLEAMSYGNCCLTSDIAECTEVCGEYGRSFRQGHADDLKEQLDLLLSDPSLTESYKKQAADYICGRFDWDAITDETINIYKGVC